ncbi:MAG: NAD-dependent epimerase/dehydratase family protein [Pseudomonadota bacterium]
MSDADRSTPTVLVLGGAGFIGRHAAAALMTAGSDVVIGTRSPGPMGSREPPHPRAARAQQREARLERLTDVRDWLPVIEDVDVVLNCVGILRQRGRETYDRVHYRAPAALAEACRERSKRLVHVSALGLDKPARSRFLTSKLAGEKAIQVAGGNWILARPSLLDGAGGFGAAWLRGIARLPFFLGPIGATGRIAALDVGEFGEALARLCLGTPEALRLDVSRIFELGGMESWNFREYIVALRRTYTDRPALCVPIPGFLARAGAHLCDGLHFSPFSFGHWELLRRDNAPSTNRLPELLGRPPLSVMSRNFD